MSRSNGNTIQGNRISNNGLDGISLSGSSDNILSSNSVTENGMNGLYLQDSDNNIIRGSLFLNNKLEGILLINSNGNLIVDNVYDRIREENSKNNIINGNKLMTEVDISGNIDINIDEPEPPGPKPPEPFPDDDICYILVHPGESIQKAINRICPGGIIEILSGTYPETLRVDKAGIVLRGIGEVFPVVSGNGVDSTIALISSEVLIENLVVTESGNPHAGIDLKASGCIIKGCRLVDNSGYGISVSSDGSIIAQNTIEGNGMGGILLQSSQDCRINLNSVGSNGGDGISIETSSGNAISSNNAIGNSVSGIRLSSSNYNSISDNTINGNTYTGCRLLSSSGNAIYQNTFDNINNAWSDSENTWYSPIEIEYKGNITYVGNHWSDYEGRDYDGDGIGDTPYSIPGGSENDSYPLTNASGPRILTVCASGCDYTNIQAAINAACPGDIIEIESGNYPENVVVNKTMILRGTGSDTIVDGKSTSSVFCIPSGVEVTLESMKITNGCNASGGGIYSLGNLILKGLTVSNNKASENGGGIANFGTLSLRENAEISDNYIEIAHSGVIRLGISDVGQGGGIYNSNSGFVSMNEVDVNRNRAIYGGGIHNSNSGIMNLTEVDIYQNEAEFGGGINNDGSMILNGAEISENNAKDGGGILTNGALTAKGGKIYRNYAVNHGGGIYNNIDSTLDGVEISENNASGYGGGIYVYSGNQNFHDCILSNNNGYQIYIGGSDSYEIYGNNISGTPPKDNSLCYSQPKGNWNSTTNKSYNCNGTKENLVGNYWSNYWTDTERDCIGDEEYSIDGYGNCSDYHPMINPPPNNSSPAIQISLDGSIQTTPPTSQAQYLLKITNLGDSEIRDINITNQLSSGIAGVSVESGPEPDIRLEPNGTHILRWQDPEPLGPGESREIGLLALLEDPLPETLISQASVRAISADGRNLSNEASLKLNAGANISIEKEADPAFAQASDPVTFRINVSNTGQMNLTSVRVNDTLPQGMSYVSDDSNGSRSGGLVTWDLGFMEPGGSMPIILTARVNEDASGLQTNMAEVTATTENGSQIFASDIAEVDIFSLNVSKEADRKTVKRGENITYTITICNDGSLPLEDVVAWDVIDKQLILLYSSMDTGEDGKWHLGTLSPGQCAVITLIVQVPDRNFRFDMTSSVSGEGFVNVADDYSTTLPQFVIKNTVYALSSSIKWQSEDTAMVTVLGEAGTELSNREHGSGTYESEEALRIITENKSIQANRSMAAMHQPVTLSLYGSRTLNSSSLWTEKIQARNRVTGLSMTGSVSHAKNISLDSRIKLDENESVVDLYSEFEGRGQFGAREKSQDGKKTFLDSQDDYAGSFKVYQKIDEYGSGLSSRRSASGTGFVAGDRRVGSSQRSHEAGTGNYSAEEAIETYTNFIHKDINLSSSPVDLSQAVPRWPNQSLKWTEGVYTRDPGKTYLGEEYSSLTEMDKETLVAGLNYIQSQANFTGKASYHQAIEGQTDLEQEYLGRYSIRYKTSLQGTARFDRPHINVIKEGQIVKPENQSRIYARYKITIENDGNEMLSPIYVNDLFPPGAVYVNSSLRPSLTQSSANWSLTHLPVGERSEIILWLEIGENLSNRLVNRAQAAGNHAAGWASASNISVLECGWLPCAPSQSDQIVVKKRAFVNESASDLVWYLLRIENHGNCTPSLTVTDSLPRGMKLIEATPDVTSYDRESNTMVWNIVSLKPNYAVSIMYRVQVTGGGRQVNQVKVEAISPEGCDINPAYDSSVLILGKKSEESWPDDWKPPEDWEFQCFDTSCV